MKLNLSILFTVAGTICCFLPLSAQLSGRRITATQLPAIALKKPNVMPGDYSGLSHIRGDLYAVISDKEPEDGFYPFTIRLDSLTGKVLSIRRNTMAGHPPARTDINGNSTRDAEDIVYHPSSGTFFIAGEGDQRILEYASDGTLTGRELHIPPTFSSDSIRQNYGFESLAYDSIHSLFWTTTEASLKQDTMYDKEGSMLLRLQSFGEDMQPRQSYWYRTDAPSRKPDKARQTFGVPALTALPDGRLLVLERDFVITRSYIGSYVRHRIYITDPLNVSAASGPLHKELLTEFQTNLKLFQHDIANFEGMCLGPLLKDGRRTLLLISDSQHNYGNVLFHLKDYLKVILLKFQ